MEQKISLTSALSALIITGLVIAGYVFGWVTPSQNPPEGDLPAPLDTSDSAQTKSGDLTINGSLTLGNQLISNVASGTAPFVVSSPTLVTNLNADKLDGYDAADLQAGGEQFGTCASSTHLSIVFTTNTYQGNFGGKSQGDSICDNEFPGYHMCSTNEVQTYGKIGCLPNIGQYFLADATYVGWIDDPGYNCNGWTTVDSSVGGRCIPSYSSYGNGSWGYYSKSCNYTQPISCCKSI